jgi:hypothetical protein
MKRNQTRAIDGRETEERETLFRGVKGEEKRQNKGVCVR